MRNWNGQQIQWNPFPFFNLYRISSLSQSVFFNGHTSSYNNEKCRLAPLKIPAQECYITSFRYTCPCHVPSPSKPQCTFHSNALTESSIRCLPWLTSCRCYTLTLSFAQTHRGTPAYRYVSICLLCTCGSWSLVFLVAVSAIPGIWNNNVAYTCQQRT